jgi:hypothetical protein
MCCGKGSSTLPQPHRTIQRAGADITNTRQSAIRQISALNSVAYFQYNGKTAMTVIGPVSKAAYRFHAPGRRVVVDLRDRQSLAAIPQLTEVRSL